MENHEAKQIVMPYLITKLWEYYLGHFLCYKVVPFQRTEVVF